MIDKTQKYYPDIEWLKENGYNINPNSLWASCGYCDTVYYLGQINGVDSIYLVSEGGIGYSENYLFDHENAVKLANRWLQEEHLPKCPSFKEKYK